MKATELRIGNLVLYSEDQTIFTVGEIDWSGIVVQNEIETTWIELIEFEPIPLTEEWLLKFGFIEDDLSFLKSNGRKSFMVSPAQDESDYLVFFQSDVGMEWCEVAFSPMVHELQNLWFALTGEEL